MVSTCVLKIHSEKQNVLLHIQLECEETSTNRALVSVDYGRKISSSVVKMSFSESVGTYFSYLRTDLPITETTVTIPILHGEALTLGVRTWYPRGNIVARQIRVEI